MDTYPPPASVSRAAHAERSGPAARRSRRRRLETWGQKRRRPVALLAALLVVLLSLGVPPAARAAVARQSEPAAVPYSGTAVLSFTQRPDLVPAAATADLGRYRIDSTFAAQDATHYRVDTRSDGPGLEADSTTTVADGTSLIWYSSRANRALRFPVENRPAPTGMTLVEGANSLPLGGTVQQAVAAINRQPGMHAQTAGQAQILGRTADIVDIRPLYEVSKPHSTSCSSAKACLKQSRGVGRARVWIDDEHGVVLRSQWFGMQKAPLANRHFLYQVTSITFGQGPTSAQLQYTPPGPIVRPPQEGGALESSGPFPASRWVVPAPFLSLAAPRGPGGGQYLAVGSGQGGDLWLGNPAEETVLFGPGTSTERGGPFVYVDERLRANGVPAALRTGTERVAGPCHVWTGLYPDGLAHVALSRGTVAALLVSNALSPAALERYARAQMCHQ